MCETVGHSLLWRFSASDKPNEAFSAHSELVREVLQHQLRAAINYMHVVGSVSHLFAPSSPPAVLWRVWSIVVNAIKRVLWRWRVSHICKKRLKSFPPLTHANAATSIVGVIGTIGILASLMNLTPTAKRLGIRASVLRSHLACAGSTAACVASAKSNAANLMDASTFTAANPPHALGVLSFGTVQYRPPTNHHPGHVNEFSVMLGRSHVRVTPRAWSGPPDVSASLVARFIIAEKHNAE